MTRKIDIEALCADKGLRITEQRKTIARVLGDSEDHPDVETLHVVHPSGWRLEAVDSDPRKILRVRLHAPEADRPRA